MRPLAIVTGSTRGLGLAIVRGLHARGFDVVGIGRSEPAAGLPAMATPSSSSAEAEAEAGGAPPPAFHHHRCDLSLTADVEGLFHESLAPHIKGRSRVVLVNNAGTLGPIGPTSSFGGGGTAAAAAAGADGAHSISRVDEALRLNLTVPLWLSGAVVRASAPSSSVRIVNISSGAAGNPYPGWATYCSTKAGLRMAGRVLAADCEGYDELRGRDVRVLDYAPGVVDTEMQLALRTTSREDFPLVGKFVGLHESGSLVRPEDSAVPVVDFAASGDGDAYSEGRYGT